MLVQGFNQTKFNYDAINHIFSGDEKENQISNNKDLINKNTKNNGPTKMKFGMAQQI